MQQALVLKYLQEAAGESCTPERRSEISRALASATCGMLWAHYAVGVMFNGYVLHHVDRLPEAFPFFALFCGDREPEGLYPDIDWSLINAEGPTSDGGTSRLSPEDKDTEESFHPFIMHDGS